MNGDADFNIVDLEHVRVPDEYRLGEEGDGWKVTRTFRAYEKNSFNPSSHEGGPFGRELTKSCGQIPAEMRQATGATNVNRGISAVVAELADSSGRRADTHVRQHLATLYTLRQVLSWNGRRCRAAGALERKAPSQSFSCLRQPGPNGR